VFQYERHRKRQREPSRNKRFSLRTQSPIIVIDGLRTITRTPVICQVCEGTRDAITRRMTTDNPKTDRPK
jgi:hypothetical protein